MVQKMYNQNQLIIKYNAIYLNGNVNMKYIYIYIYAYNQKHTEYNQKIFSI